MATKPRKKLTNAQKAMNAKMKKELQEKGFLPPDKKPLNRKKFALEVLSVVKSDGFSFYDHLPYIMQGFAHLTPLCIDGKVEGPVTSEEIGALKVLKIAINLKALADENQGAYLREYYEKAVKPIIDL